MPLNPEIEYIDPLIEFAHLIDSPAANDSLTNGLTILTAKFQVATLKKRNLLLTKRWVDGDSVKQNFPELYHPRRIYPENLKALIPYLKKLHSQPNRCIIRGELNPDITDKFVNREAKRGTFRDTPTKYAMIDLDGVKVKRDWLDTPIKAIKEVVRTALPDAFQGVRMIVIPSASQGFKEGLRLHLWMELDEPMTGAEWKTWFDHNYGKDEKIVDGSIYGAQSVHYTAAPMLDNTPPKIPETHTHLAIKGSLLSRDDVLLGVDLTKKVKGSNKRSNVTDGEYLADDRHVAKMTHALEHLGSEGEHFDYWNWLYVGMGLHFASGGAQEGLDLWHLYSRFCGEYDAEEINSKWDTFENSTEGKTERTVYGMAGDCGWRESQFNTEYAAEEFAEIVDDSDDLLDFGDETAPPDIHQAGIPDLLLNPPGFVGEMAKEFRKNAFKDNPIIDVITAFMVVSILSKNQYTIGGWGTTLNLFITVIADTGVGKDQVKKTLAEIKTRLIAEDAEEHAVGGYIPLIVGRITSGAAITRTLSMRRNLTILLDEMGKVLGTNRGSDNDMLAELLSMYGSAASVEFGKNYANADNNIPDIVKPFLNFFGTTTGLTLKEALSRDDVENGLMGRMMIINIAQEGKAKPDTIRKPIKQGVIDRLLTLYNSGNDMEGGEHFQNEEFINIKWSPEAERMVKDYWVKRDAQKLKSGVATKGLYSRLHEHANTIAGLLALSTIDRPDVVPMVTAEQMEWSIAFIDWCLYNAEELSGALHGSKYEGYTQDMLDFITNVEQNKNMQGGAFLHDMSKGWVPKSAIIRGMRGIRQRERDEILEDLVEGKAIKLKITKVQAARKIVRKKYLYRAF